MIFDTVFRENREGISRREQSVKCKQGERRGGVGDF